MRRNFIKLGKHWNSELKRIIKWQKAVKNTDLFYPEQPDRNWDLRATVSRIIPKKCSLGFLFSGFTLFFAVVVVIVKNVLSLKRVMERNVGRNSVGAIRNECAMYYTATYLTAFQSALHCSVRDSVTVSSWLSCTAPYSSASHLEAHCTVLPPHCTVLPPTRLHLN
jgi:hypothetical protein